jgi:hypothetical protein
MPKRAGYRDIMAYGYDDPGAHGTVITFPSRAGAGDTVYLTVRAKENYLFVEGSLRLPPPPQLQRYV